ncbi:MAG: tetratricopeptide repeat protein [Opitutae bacterium]|jgi:tetratricopeptide (TPR) repeat protein|nr:tetratricopeptide repeat protein [Opitutae bacterium]
MKLTIKLYCIFICAFILRSQCAGGQEDRLFYDAVRTEAAGDLDQAINLYLEASTLSHSANLHGNLANLYFKKEQYGHSILHFRKALLLNPRDTELSANLNFAYEMAKMPPPMQSFASNYFSANFLSFWIIICAIIFWTGLLILFYIFFFKTSKKTFLYFTICWVISCLLSCFAACLSLQQQSELYREVIVHFPQTENNHSKTIPLRRFAGESNSANTNILPGESLIIRLGNDGVSKSHQIANGKTWYLANSADGKKKGWIREDEFGWIIDPNS